MSFNPECIDVAEFLEALDIRNVSQATANEMRFSCPYPDHMNGDENASAYMNVETTAWYCHGCKNKGNAIHFAAFVLSVSPIEATSLLRERWQPGFVNPDERNTVAEVRRVLLLREELKKIVQPELPEEAVERFAVDWFAVEKAMNNGDPTFGMDYMIRRGFGPETLEEWDFGFDPITERVTFAVRDLGGRLIGFKARALDDRHPKYLVLGDRPGKPERYGWPCYHTSRVVFGLDKATKIEDPHGEDEPRHLIVCEGELNAIALQMHRFPGVAVNGSNFSDTQADLLLQEADAVTIFFDDDEAGHKGTKIVAERLKPFMPVYIVSGHAKDPADMDGEEQRAAIEAAEGSTRFSILHGW